MRALPPTASASRAGSDEMIDQFRRTFGTRYHDLRVGQVQVLTGGSP